MGDDRQMKKIRVGILGVAAAAALCFTAGAVYLYARGVWQMPIPADRALPVLCTTYRWRTVSRATI